MNKTASVSETTYNNSALIFRGEIPEGKVGWQSPSNIALVKYWGKKEVQIPCNPSVSFSLNESYTETVVEYRPAHSEKSTVVFYLNGVINEQFGKKIDAYFKSIESVYPFLNQLDFTIHSTNTFPHSAGIASSASGMSALALCLCSIEKKYFGTPSGEHEFFQKASFLARLGSGSAARSLYGGLVSWGKIDGRPETSNLWGTPQTENLHPLFSTFRDSILIVDAKQKKVSSRVGHGLMKTNVYADARFKQAQTNIVELLDVMKNGDLERFINITESEALTLHAMMMTSNPYYLLMKPETLQIIERIFGFRKSTGIPVCFTLDAGPNIHLLYPEKVRADVGSFIQAELKQFTRNATVIEDRVGSGPVKLDL
jgi:diphosphomevalonate decarboxylase